LEKPNFVLFQNLLKRKKKKNDLAGDLYYITDIALLSFIKINLFSLKICQKEDINYAREKGKAITFFLQ
jgi:hypothetical protein